MPQRSSWSADDVPDLQGRTALITGATRGIGLETAKVLASRGAAVLLGARNRTRGAAARAQVRGQAPRAEVVVVPLDLADLASVEQAAAMIAADHPKLDILCNNAGVMGTPLRRTADGFELQFGTNHLGHFALTGRLRPQLLAAPAARVVTVASQNHRMGRLDLDNLDGRAGYRRWQAYGQSKLANLLFAFELHRRAEGASLGFVSVAAHPGYAGTDLQRVGARMEQAHARERAMMVANRLFSQSPHAGALPSLYAATAPDVEGGDYIGPDGPGEIRGRPTKVSAARQAYDPELARQLWDASEELTGLRFDLPVPAAS